MSKLTTRRNLILVDICLLVLLGITIFAVVSLASGGARLNPKGAAFELNTDASGHLWISDAKVQQVWDVDPISGTYKIYSVSGSPVDARQADGWMWWADGKSNLVGQVSTTDGTFTEWQVPDATGFLGTSLDDEGRFYATDSSNPYLYRLDPTKSELCTFALPGFGASNYLVRDGGYLWLDDWFDTTILRLNIDDNTLTSWSLPPDSSPFGMALDGQGKLWYADQGNKKIVRLDPLTNQLTSFAIPVGNYPQMVASASGMIWYTEESLPSFGRLDPLVAESTTLTLTNENQSLTPNCINFSPSGTGNSSITEGRIKLRDMTYTTILNSGGWLIYQMPENSDPWGIALTDYGYLVDSGRQVLVRFPTTQELPPIVLNTATETSQATILPTQTITPKTTIPATQAITPKTTIPPTQAITPALTPTAAPTQELNLAYLPIVVRASPVGSP